MNTYYVNLSDSDKTTVISYYENLRDKIYSMIYYLGQSISALNGVNASLLKNYNIDDSKISNVDIESLRENLKDRVSYLRYTVIPSIDSKINSLM